MKRTGILLLIIYLQSYVNAQDTINYWPVDTLNSFNQAHSPFENTLTMWLMRQNLTLNAIQANIGNTCPLSEKIRKEDSRTYLEFYLPAIHTNSFSVMLGTSYSKFPILSRNDSLNKTLIDACRFWLPVQYTYNRWKFTALYEYFQRGDNNSLYSDIGNTHRAFFITSYNFNTKWQLSLMAAYMITHMENEDRDMMLPAFQVRYKPTPNLILVTGAPVVFACEWTVFSKFDIAVSQLLLDETDAFIRYNISPGVGISLNYKSTYYSSSDIYFNHETFSLEEQDVTFNNLTQNQQSISVKFGIRTLKNIGLIVSGGYNLGQTVHLYDNEKLAGKVDGRNEFYIGINLQYLKYL